jgi:hypothetical protein
MGSFAGLVKSSGRNPVQVIAGHGSALLFAVPSLAFGSFGATTKSALSSETLLALIYTYPLLAVAAFTLFVKLRAPQDYFGGVILMAIALFALWASSDLQGTRGFSFGAGTTLRMFGVLLLALGAGRWPCHGRPSDRRPEACELRLARPVIRVAVRPFLCAHDPAAWSGGLGIRELRDLGVRHAGDPLD